MGDGNQFFSELNMELKPKKTPNYSQKLLLRHFTSTTDKGNDIALFVPAKTRRGIHCYRALILADTCLIAGERLSLFPHKGINPKIKARLEELKAQTAEILAKRQLQERASFKTLEQVAAKLEEVERRTVGLPPLPPKTEKEDEHPNYSDDDDSEQKDEPVEYEEEVD